MEHDQSIPYIISNVVAIATAIIAMRWPTVARALLGFIFISAAFFNSFTVITDPAIYLTYGELTPSQLYRSIILGPFARHVEEFVLTIAMCQLFIGVFTLYRGQLMTAAMIGGIVFLIAIAPLWIGSAFPSTLILAMAYAILLQKRTDTNIYGSILNRLKYSQH